jgi:nitronate monooxygenase
MNIQRSTQLPPILQTVRLPVIAAPLFIISVPDLVIAQCKAGVVGSFPALNAREKEGEPVELERWLTKITEELDRHNQKNPDNPAAPFAVNQIVHRSNKRLMRDVEICAKWKVPIWITSLGARPEVNEAAHSGGGIVLHDIINNTFAHKAVDRGADGLIAVAAGAGGHAGPQSPFALIQEIREWFNGPLLLSGSIASGKALLSSLIMGADFGYIGSPFIATKEANASETYKNMIVDSTAEDILLSSLFTGVSGNYLKPSIENAGMDPNNLVDGSAKDMDFDTAKEKPKTWSQIFGCGQGISNVKKIETVSQFVDNLDEEFKTAISEFKNKFS